MEQLSRLGHLANRYLGMRHGESKANVAGLIVSRIETDRSGDYGLSDRGRLQAAEAARRCGLGAATVIRSSDFARAWQTAQIVRERIGAAEVVAAQALRERSFGDLEGTPATGYTHGSGGPTKPTEPANRAKPARPPPPAQCPTESKP